MILMIMLSDDMSSLSHDEFMEVICGAVPGREPIPGRKMAREVTSRSSEI